MSEESITTITADISALFARVRARVRMLETGCSKALFLLEDCDDEIRMMTEEPDEPDLLVVRSMLARIAGVLRSAVCLHPHGFSSSVGSCPHCGEDAAPDGGTCEND